MGVIVLMLVGILFCFLGYKYFRTVLFLGFGTVACYASFLLTESLTVNLVIRMFLTVSLTFLGICFVYFLNIIFGYFLDRLRIRNALGKHIYLIAAPLGAAVTGLTIYWFIWRNFVTAVVIAAVCGVSGLIFQHFQRAKAVRFKCYNDLLRKPRPVADTGIAEALVPVPEAEPVLESEPTSEPKPEPEPESEPKPQLESELNPDPAISVEQVSAPRIVVTSGSRRRQRKKPDSRLVKGAVVVAAGIGLFIAGRMSKGRD